MRYTVRLADGTTQIVEADNFSSLTLSSTGGIFGASVPTSVNYQFYNNSAERYGSAQYVAMLSGVKSITAASESAPEAVGEQPASGAAAVVDTAEGHLEPPRAGLVVGADVDSPACFLRGAI